MIHFLRLVVMGCLAAGCLWCKINPTGQALAPSPEEAYAKLAEASKAGQAGVIYDLMSTTSRWAVMSIFKDQKTMCGLIQEHYPADRQAAELRRCKGAYEAKDERAFFEVMARELDLFKSLKHLGKMGTVSKKDKRAEIGGGADKVAFCQEEKGWGYCGLEAWLERIKVRTARDLTSVKENAAAFKHE